MSTSRLVNIGRRAAAAASPEAASAAREAAAGTAKSILGLASLKAGDVVLQNGLNPTAESITQLGFEQGLHVVSVYPAGSDFKEKSKTHMLLGGLALVTDEYAGSFALQRLISDLGAPSLVVNHSQDTSVLADLVKIAAPKSVLAMTGGVALPAEVQYAGMVRRPVTWKEFTSKRGIEVKTV